MSYPAERCDVYTTPWTTRARKDAAKAMRDGERPEALALRLGRTMSALKLAVVRAGESWRVLCQQGRMARVKAILAQGGGVEAVCASEGVKVRMAQRLMTDALAQGDRRRTKRTYTQAEQRTIYLSVREIGIKATADKLGFHRSTVRRAAIAYRAEVLPTSPALGRGLPARPRQRKPRASDAPGGA